MNARIRQRRWRWHWWWIRRRMKRALSRQARWHSLPIASKGEEDRLLNCTTGREHRAHRSITEFCPRGSCFSFDGPFYKFRIFRYSVRLFKTSYCRFGIWTSGFLRQQIFLNVVGTRILDFLNLGLLFRDLTVIDVQNLLILVPLWHNSSRLYRPCRPPLFLVLEVTEATSSHSFTESIFFLTLVNSINKSLDYEHLVSELFFFRAISIRLRAPLSLELPLYHFTFDFNLWYLSPRTSEKAVRKKSSIFSIFLVFLPRRVRCSRIAPQSTFLDRNGTRVSLID